MAAGQKRNGRMIIEDDFKLQDSVSINAWMTRSHVHEGVLVFLFGVRGVRCVCNKAEVTITCK